jgi:hypothetical protein
MDASISGYRSAVGRVLDAIDEAYEVRRGLRPALTQDDLDAIAFLDGHLHDRLWRCMALLQHLPTYMAPSESGSEYVLAD